MKFKFRRSKNPEPKADRSGHAAWISDLIGNYDVGYKLGLRQKRFGHDWESAAHAPDQIRPDLLASIDKYTVGERLERADFPEAAAVWDESSFRRAKDLFAVGGFYCVKGKLAEVLARFDLGEGGLIPFPIYQADLITPYEGNFFLLKFGATKSAILPERCEDASRFFVDKQSGTQVWHINRFTPAAKVSLSSACLAGADLWFDDAVHQKVFMSDALGHAISDLGMADIFRLVRCQID